ncbi:MAG: hypothetical protein VZR28_12475 [Candidatus Cryptobacteroides sp.]|nr:hypothetical protein [Candidatus Cryptobacteroides sp.]
MIKGITKIEFNSQGFKDILFSPGTKELVQGVADQIQAEANAGIQEDSEGFSSNVVAGGYGGGRYVGFVTSLDNKAAQAESEDKVLSKAVHG